MNKLLFTLILVGAQGVVIAQDFSVSVGHSVKAWGIIESNTSLSIEYKIPVFKKVPVLQGPILGLHYFHQWDAGTHYGPNGGYRMRKESTPAISLLPLNLKYLRAGGILTQKEYPVQFTTQTNFYVQAALPVWRFELRYTHISSGFHYVRELNPGIDFVSLAVRF